MVKRVTFLVISALVVALVAACVAAANAAPDSLLPVHAHHWRGGTPVGFTLSVLQHKELSEGTVVMADGQLAQARQYGANTIRLQITQDELVGQGGHKFNAEYMDVITQVVNNGVAMGLRMVINAQTEWSPGYHDNERMPTHATHVFWHDIVHAFANRPHVVFDLFNEPGTKHANGQMWTWAQWHDNFQPLVTYVNRHADNQIWLEGIQFASTWLNFTPITGKHLVYTYHHLGKPWNTEMTQTPPTWDQAFGFLADKGLPMVDAEFMNGPGFNHLSRPVVRQYLQYVRERHIGLLVFGLVQHKMVTRYLEGK